MNQKLLTSLKTQIENKISNHVANIKTYLDTKEDSSIIEKVIEFELEQISKLQNYVNVLEKYFLNTLPNDISSNFKTEETTQPTISWEDEEECSKNLNFNDDTPNWENSFDWEFSESNNLNIDNMTQQKIVVPPKWAEDILKNSQND
jgi:hypothetical protein